MSYFTIFCNTRTGACAAVYDFQLPTPTGIGHLEKWVPVYHGQTSGLLDKARQRQQFVVGMTPSGEGKPPARR